MRSNITPPKWYHSINLNAITYIENMIELFSIITSCTYLYSKVYNKSSQRFHCDSPHCPSGFEMMPLRKQASQSRLPAGMILAQEPWAGIWLSRKCIVIRNKEYREFKNYCWVLNHLYPWLQHCGQFTFPKQMWTYLFFFLWGFTWAVNWMH